jgi:hypothetical protein
VSREALSGNPSRCGAPRGEARCTRLDEVPTNCWAEVASPGSVSDGDHVVWFRREAGTINADICGTAVWVPVLSGRNDQSSGGR